MLHTNRIGSGKERTGCQKKEWGGRALAGILAFIPIFNKNQTIVKITSRKLMTAAFFGCLNILMILMMTKNIVQK